MFHAGFRGKDPGGKAFSNASIGESGEKAFPAGADDDNEGKIFGLYPDPMAGKDRTRQPRHVDTRVVSPVNNPLKAGI